MAMISAVFLITTGCTYLGLKKEESEIEKFTKWLEETIALTNTRPDLKPLPIKTKRQKKDFYELAFEAYTGEISAKEFVATLQYRFPAGYPETIRFIAGRLPKQ
jgi:hypothetical protein